MSKRVSQKDNNYFVAAWNRGDSMKDIASYLGISVYAAMSRRKRLIKNGVNISIRRIQKIPLNYLVKLRAMRESGMSIVEIATKENKALGTIHEQLIRSGCNYVNKVPGTTTYSKKILARTILKKRNYKQIMRNDNIHV